MVAYIAAIGTVFTLMVILTVYAADLYEREPLELIERCLLAGMALQLTLVVLTSTVLSVQAWSGWLLLASAVAAAAGAPVLFAFGAARDAKEVDEAFDGGVYGVAFSTGVGAVIHMFSLRTAAFERKGGEVAAESVVLDFRDLALLLFSETVRSDLLRVFVIVAIGFIAGCAWAVLKARGRGARTVLPVVTGIGLGAMAVDLAAGGTWLVRAVLLVMVIAVGWYCKRSSPFREKVEVTDQGVVYRWFRFALLVLGALTFVVLVLAAVIDEVRPPAGAASTAASVQTDGASVARAES